MQEWLRALAPNGARVLIMLHAYIDDSGTHDDAEVVTMGAFIAPVADWTAFEFDWCAILDREPLRSFHMSDCEAGRNPYFWDWPRRAALIHDLRHIIIRYQMLGTALSISRKDWDELVVGKVREDFGSSIEFAFGGAIGQLVLYLRQLWPTQKLAIVVDDQKQRKEDLQRIAGNYRDLKVLYPEIESLAFASMQNCVPLQAADMIAWESYRYAQEWLKTGGKPVARAHFQDFLAHAPLAGAIMGREEITKQVAAGYAPLL